MPKGKDVIGFAKDKQAVMVDLKFMDFLGLWQHFSIPIAELTEAVFEEGLGFDGSSIRGFKRIEQSDMYFLPDPATYALLPWRGSTFLGGAIDVLAPVSEMVIVVAGKNAPQLQPLVYASSAYQVVNRDPQRGQFSSLRLGLQEVLNHGRDAAIIALVDRPPANAATLAARCPPPDPPAATNLSGSTPSFWNTAACLSNTSLKNTDTA